jgi:hypothetical protein
MVESAKMCGDAELQAIAYDVLCTLSHVQLILLSQLPLRRRFGMQPQQHRFGHQLLHARKRHAKGTE